MTFINLTLHLYLLSLYTLPYLLPITFIKALQAIIPYTGITKDTGIACKKGMQVFHKGIGEDTVYYW